MLNLKDFEPYTGQSTDNKAILVWSKSKGYFFMAHRQMLLAMAENCNFKLIGVEVC